MTPFETLQKQIDFKPVITGGVFQSFADSRKTLIAGLGGSRLAGGFLQSALPDSGIMLHSSFGLPNYAAKGQYTVVASSASGDVAETLSVFEEAHTTGLPSIAISKGGALLKRAAEYSVPYIQFPDIGVPPRESVVFSLMAHLAAFGMDDTAAEFRSGLHELHINEVQESARAIADFVSRKQILLYAPQELEGLMRLWKINFNETSRVPSFISIVPEAFHGEIAVFDGSEHTVALSKDTVILLVMSQGCNERIRRRMFMLQSTLDEYAVSSRIVELPQGGWKGLGYGIALSMELAHMLREKEGIPVQASNMIARFKEKTSLL